MTVRGGIAALTLLAACGSPPPASGPAGSAPATSVPSASTPVTKASTPPGAVEIFAVDWPSERRASLEIAMKDHVAVIAHDGRSVRVLEDCMPPAGASYESKTSPVKEDVLRLESYEEVRSMLVYTAARGGKRLETEMANGAVVDLAIAITGSMRTPRESVRRSELRGDCSGATHFVRSASIGAFVMTAGKREKHRTAAEIFGGTINATSASTGLVEARDGAIEDCRAGKTAGCRAPLQLAIAPLAD